MRWMLLLFLACAKQTTPVEIGGSDSIGALPAASSATPAPPPPSIPIEPSGQLTLPPILYRVASDEILPESYPTLQRVLDFMHARTDFRLVRIEAHSDSLGSATFNMAMTQKRAESAAKWLVDHGVECNRIEAVGYGQTRPIVPNTTEEYRAKNRRVVFFVADVPLTKTFC